MSTQPNQSTNRPSETDPGANGSAPDLNKPDRPGDGGVHDLTRPEGIAPVSDPIPSKDPSWSPSASQSGSSSLPALPAAGASGGQQRPPGGPQGAPTMAPPAPPGSTQSKRAVARLGGSGGRTPRRAQLQLSRLEPWSVMKFSFVMSLVAFIVLLVAVTVLYVILSGLGVFDAISETVNDLTRDQSSSGGVDAANWFGFGRIFGYTVLVGALNVLLITALSTVGSVIYNLAADLVGGIEVTLKEAE